MRRKRERKNKMRIDSDYFKGEHLSLDVLKTMTSLCHHRYLFEDMPPYPKAEFHIANISHVTTAANLDGIMDSSGFKGGCETDLLYWSLHINKSDIDEAEDKYLRKEFPSSAAKATGKRQDPFLCKFTTSPTFKPDSRYGNYQFIFPIKRLLNLYQEQFCFGKQPVMRIYETEIFKKAISYTVVIHSPDCKMFDEYPIFRDGYTREVCEYRRKESTVLWRAQAICSDHEYEIIIDKDNEIISTKENTGLKYYVYDEVALAFHLPAGKIFKIEYAFIHLHCRCDLETSSASSS
ncbi:uncharacterized protein LOC130115792 isoform X2 [Lampris incognitus]|uniref:uncharacterized protein LOC130115792 isoform X2 n=1 Tax=Lampris incognitus TaxID=2546036 RepID=UPI0024B4BF8D|nr:uncharacterized protein LOC130115792 isoform X2 [Lampris incognitus]